MDRTSPDRFFAEYNSDLKILILASPRAIISIFPVVSDRRCLFFFYTLDLSRYIFAARVDIPSLSRMSRYFNECRNTRAAVYAAGIACAMLGLRRAMLNNTRRIHTAVHIP